MVLALSSPKKKYWCVKAMAISSEWESRIMLNDKDSQSLETEMFSQCIVLFLKVLIK